ncbi:MAG: IclR family transcriptional regulator [Candidatus Rokuibacteriota bacterium]
MTRHERASPRPALPRRVDPRSRRNPLTKLLRVLNWMIDARGEAWGVRELGQGMGLAPSTVHRILGLLEAHGLVQSDPTTRGYRLGLEFHRMAWRTTARFSVRQVALPLMRELVGRCNETAGLGLYDHVRMEMIVAEVVESTHPLRYVIALNQWMPVYTGASGLAIMAFLPEEERRAIIDRTKLRPLTDRTIVRRAQLEQELRRIRQQGYARSIGQRIPSAVGVAAPIVGPAGRVIGDLWLTIPESRFQPRAEAQLASLVIDYARRVSELLGRPVVPVGPSPADAVRRRRGGDVGMDGRSGRR